MPAYPLLFSPGQLGPLPTKNRVVMAPMVRNYSDDEGRVTPQYLAHLARIAAGGVGTMILDAAYVRPDGKGFTHQCGLHHDGVIDGLRDVVQAAHAHGVVIGPQLFHAGRQTSSARTGLPLVAPSAIPNPGADEIPHALTVDEIHVLVQAFAQAARRARDAGCDFVEIHGAHGYLVTEFLSAFSNAREDAYGGSLAARMRFLEEIIEATRAQVGPDFPLTVRLSGDEMVPEGLTLADTQAIARRLEALGIAAVHISAGNYASYNLGYLIQPMAIPDAPLVHLAEGVKQVVRMPVIAVGKIRYPHLAEEVLRRGQADFIALGRSFLADPDWPRKAQEGRGTEINHCIACNQGCITRLFENLDVWCTVNPATSREQEFAAPRPPRKRLMVVGGGPAGMEAAKIAAERGHAVVLLEETDHLGGQLIAAAAAPYRPGWRELQEYLLRELARLGVEVRLNTKATVPLIQQEQPEVVIIAIGSSPVRLRIPGSEEAHVINARDLLEGHVEAIGRVIIAGGGCSGAQTAEYLAERGHPVTIVEMLGAIAADAPAAERELLLGRLARRGVRIQMETKILRVEPAGVVVERAGGLETLPADTVVLCLGARPNDGLAEALIPFVPQVRVVGDAVQARKVTDAIVEGGLAGLSA